MGGPGVRWAAASAVAGLVLAACGGGSGDGAATGDVVGPTSTLSCAVDASVDTAQGLLESNAWNSQAAGSRVWQQCLLQRTVNGQPQYGWSWQWPTDLDTVVAYPRLVRGANPWVSGPGNDSRFPRRVGDIQRLLLSHDVDTSATGMYSLAWSMWLINTPSVASPPDEAAITTELMVWAGAASAAGFTADAVPLAQVRLGGIDWQVYADRNWGDSSGGSGHRWTHIVYLSPTAGAQMSIDAKLFLADAQARGLLSADDHVANVELGNELAGGSGRTWVRQFGVVLE